MEKEKSIDEKLDIILRKLNEVLSKLNAFDKPVRTLDDEPKNPPPRPPGGG